ncbi:AraC family transcriptional regulator [Labedaea rhizosphaerae]|uniref:AraC-like DNA-binding protein n=1 Tax=Labedaea rhizosphaerae TaxID=598644 RepID=A0A4R6SM50_LABRH|nr:AraC family transcriptional regulator [Labedaea rhizosphaerae]TDQ05057.1 AraC-like DNA-binding protein [Labedaea rhizosphaerae]
MTAPPGDLADRPSRTHDLLSELLRSVRLSGERIVAHAPPPPFSVGFTGVGSLHIVDEGDLTLRIDGHPRDERLSAGDLVLLPRGDTHHLSADDPAVAARWLCGTFTIGDPRASHLLGSLPPVIVLRGEGGPALEGLEVARRMLVLEMESPTQGSAVMVARILDLLFIQILRAWAASAAEPNWLAAALDPQIGPALSAMHRTPGREWTVEDLARECALSRSAFAARFVAGVGIPPATYLAHVRLDAATDLLRGTSLPVALIAKNVGYTSEAAFSRAFKNHHGSAPAHWRRDARAKLR